MNNPINKKDDKLFENATLSLVRTNPKLSGNIKLVIDSNNNIFLSTFEAIRELSDVNKIKYPINYNTPLNVSIYNFIKNTRIDSEALYKAYRKKDDLDVSNDFSLMYDDTYLAGVRYKDSLQYSEKLSAYYPIWLRKKNIPKNFIIFKANGPFNPNGNLSSYTTTNIQTWINDFRIFKVFDLSENSNVGKVLQNFVNNKYWTDDPIYFNINTPTEYKGISIEDGSLCGKYENTKTDLHTTDKTVLEKNDYVVRGFQRNNLLCANAINLEFLFDDSEVGTIDRYFGLYADFDEIKEFYLDPTRANFVENIPNFDTWDSNNIQNRFIQNSKVRLYTNNLTNFIEPSELQQNMFWCVKSANNSLYSVDTNSWTLPNNDNLDLVVKNNQPNNKLNLKDFIKFEIVDESLSCEKVFNSNSLPNVRFQLLTKPNDGDCIRIYYTDNSIDEYIDMADNHTIIASSIIPAGQYQSNTFSNLGNIETICNAMIKCINNLDENFNIGYTLISLGGGNMLLLSKIQSVVRNFATVQFYTSSNVPKFKLFENAITTNIFTFNQSPISSLQTATNGLLTTAKLVGSFAQNCVKIKRRELTTLQSYTNIYLQNVDNTFSLVEFENLGNLKICQYTENIKKTPLGEFYYPQNSTEFVLIVVDYKLPSSKKLQIQKKVYNYFGVLSLTHLVDFDTELEYSTYSKNLVSDRLGLYNFLTNGGLGGNTTTYPTPINNPSIFDNVYSETSDFVNSGEFFKLSDYAMSEILYNSEYERLQEFYIKNVANVSKTTQWIVRWCSKFLDSRSNNYALKTSKSFGVTNFAPSFREFSTNPKLLTQDWLLLGGVPPTYTQAMLENATDRFFEIPTFNDFFNDNFFKTFLERSFVNEFEIPAIYLYSNVYKENSDFVTMFRGVYCQFFKKSNLEKIDNNIDNLSLVDFDFSDYKFAAILLPTQTGSKITIARNDVEKSILLCCEADIFDSVSNQYIDSNLNTITYIDRMQLYSNFSKLSCNSLTNEIVYSDVLLSGSIESWTIEQTGVLTFFGNVNLTNNTFADFENEIYPNSLGVFDKIVITAGADVLEISNIIKVTTTTIKASSFTLNGLPITVSSSVLALSMTYGYIIPALRTSTYTYKNGGYNANLRILNKINFANLADLINNGSSQISYVAKLIDFSIVENDFFIKLQEPTNVVNNYYISAVEDDRPPVLRNSYGGIGYKIVNNSTTVSELNFSYGCPMQPLFKKIFEFSTPIEYQFLENFYNRNVKVFSETPNILLYYNKISNRSSNILLGGGNTNYKPLYPKINEINIQKIFLNPLISNFDYGFYLEHIDKVFTEKVFGVVADKQLGNILNAAIPLSSDSFSVAVFDTTFVANIVNFDDIVLNQQSELYISQSNTITTCQFNIKKTLLNLLKTQFQTNFQKYFIGDVLNVIINTFGSTENYLNNYLINNVLNRYEVSQVIVYTKKATSPITSLVSNFELNTTEFVKQLTMSIKPSNIAFRSFENLDFNIDIPNFEIANTVYSFVVKIKIR